MKNESWKYPFPTLEDKMFDGNKDGRLDATETFFRDMHLDEMSRKAAESNREQGIINNYRTSSILDYLPDANTEEDDDNTEIDTSESTPLFVTILVIILVLASGFGLAEIAKMWLDFLGF